MSLVDDLQISRSTLEEFKELTIRVLNYFPEIVSSKATIRNYIINASVVAGTKKFVRPINLDLFIFDEKTFNAEFETFSETLKKLKLDEKIFVL